MPRWVGDEVWRALDPGVGRLTRATTKRLWLAGLLAIVVGYGGIVSWNSGLIVPQLVWPSTGSEWSVPPSGPVSFTVPMRNAGLVPVTVLGAGRSGPGMDLIHVAGQFPTTLAPGEVMTFVIVYRITDCAAMPRGDWPVPIRVRRWWGEQTREIDEPFVVQWQVMIYETWCVHPGSPAHLVG